MILRNDANIHNITIIIGSVFAVVVIITLLHALAS